jgi:hypothetical protein
LIIGAFAAATHADEGKDESRGKEGKKFEQRHDKDWEKKHEKDRERKRESRADGRSYFHEHGYTRLDIPQGHLPPPGECRIWYPDRPAGHQPPPTRCSGVHVPAGGWLIERPRGEARYRVSVYDPYQPAIVLNSGMFDLRGTTLVLTAVIR